MKLQHTSVCFFGSIGSIKSSPIGLSKAARCVNINAVLMFKHQAAMFWSMVAVLLGFQIC